MLSVSIAGCLALPGSMRLSPPFVSDQAKNSLRDLWHPQAVFVESSRAESVTIVLLGGRRAQPFFSPDGFDAVAGLAGFALSALTGLWLLPFVMRTAFSVNPRVMTMSNRSA